MTRERLCEILDRFPSLSIAVFGDFYLDKYLEIDPALGEPSLETGLEAGQVVAVRCSPGAAGTVAGNLAALRVGTVAAFGAIGRDGEGFDLTHALRSRGIDTRGLLVSQQRRTPAYMKPIADGREMERLDIQNREPPRKRLQRKLVEALEERLPEFDGVFVSDQCTIPDCGLVTEWMRGEITRLAASRPQTRFLADSRRNVAEFRGVMLKPNRSEAATALGAEADAVELAKRLADKNGAPAVFITQGAAGIAVWDGERGETVPAPKADGPIDIVGAGDAAGAALLASLCGEATPVEAARIANLTAAVTIRKLGTTGTASPREIVEVAGYVGR